MFKENFKWFISTLLAILASLMMFIFSNASPWYKNLECRIISHTELVDKKVSIEGLEIKIDGKNTDNVSLYNIKVRNSGFESILSDDFKKPLLIEFEDKAHIFKYRIKNSIPKNLSLSCRLKDNAIVIDPLLLNPNDSFEIEIYSSSNKDPFIDTRIAGIKEIKCSSNEHSNSIKKKFFGITDKTLSFFLTILYGTFYSFGYRAKSQRTKIANLIVAIILGLSGSRLLSVHFVDFKTFQMQWLLIPLFGTILGIYLSRYLTRIYLKK